MTQVGSTENSQRVKVGRYMQLIYSIIHFISFQSGIQVPVLKQFLSPIAGPVQPVCQVTRHYLKKKPGKAEPRLLAALWMHLRCDEGYDLNHSSNGNAERRGSIACGRREIVSTIPTDRTRCTCQASFGSALTPTSSSSSVPHEDDLNKGDFLPVRRILV